MTIIIPAVHILLQAPRGGTSIYTPERSKVIKTCGYCCTTRRHPKACDNVLPLKSLRWLEGAVSPHFDWGLRALFLDTLATASTPPCLAYSSVTAPYQTASTPPCLTWQCYSSIPKESTSESQCGGGEGDTTMIPMCWNKYCINRALLYSSKATINTSILLLLPLACARGDYRT